MTYVKDRERRFRNPLKQTFFPGTLRNGKNFCPFASIMDFI